MPVARIPVPNESGDSGGANCGDDDCRCDGSGGDGDEYWGCWWYILWWE